MTPRSGAARPESPLRWGPVAPQMFTVHGTGATPVEYEPDQTPPVSGVLYPNGGQSLTVGDQAHLQWSASDKWAGLASVDLACFIREPQRTA